MNMKRFCHFTERFVILSCAIFVCGCSDGGHSASELTVKFPAPSVSETEIVWFNLAGRDVSAAAAWLKDTDADILALGGTADAITEIAGVLDGYECVATDGAGVLSKLEIVESVELGIDGVAALYVLTGDMHIVACDFAEACGAAYGDLDADASKWASLDAAFASLLDATYNNPQYLRDSQSWFICGSTYFLSSMDCNIVNVPEWYPADITDGCYAADISAWNNNLKDCVPLHYRRFVPTFRDPVTGCEQRIDYIYVSNTVWRDIVEVEVVDDDFTIFDGSVPSHRPIRYKIRSYVD